MVNFIPESPEEKAGRLGYKSLGLEQASLEDGLSGYTSKVGRTSWEKKIYDMLSAGGADFITIMYGTAERPAVLLRFGWMGVPIEIVQVTLPFSPGRGRAKSKEEQAMRQALFHLYNEVRFELERRHFHPDTPAFVTYMLTPRGKTIGALVAENETLALPEGE